MIPLNNLSAKQNIHTVIELPLALGFFHCSQGLRASLLMRWRLLAAINNYAQAALTELLQRGRTAMSRQYLGHFVQWERQAAVHVRSTDIWHRYSSSFSRELRRAAIKGYELEVIGFARASSRHTLSHTQNISRAWQNTFCSLMWDFCHDVLDAPETLWVYWIRRWGNSARRHGWFRSLLFQRSPALTSSQWISRNKSSTAF